MRKRSLTTPIARWLKENGKTNTWLAAYIGAETPESVQHWVAGRRPIPRRYVDTVSALLAGVAHTTQMTTGRTT